MMQSIPHVILVTNFADMIEITIDVSVDSRGIFSDHFLFGVTLIGMLLRGLDITNFEINEHCLEAGWVVLTLFDNSDAERILDQFST